MDIEIRTMRSVMRVGDLEQAVTFWKSIGLIEDWRVSTDPAVVGMSGESLKLMLIPTDHTDEIHPQSVYVTMLGVDAMHERCRAARPDDTGPIGNREYGLRDFSVIDPWHHMVVFGEELGGSADDQSA